MLAFPDFTDIDPYDDWPDHMFDLFDRTYNPVAPEFEPSAQDVLYQGSDMDNESMVVLYFSRGHDWIQVNMKRSFEGSGYIPQAEDHLEKQNALEICQTFIHNVDWGHVNIVRAHRNKAGKWVPQPGKRLILSLFDDNHRCPLHIIDENEVRITRWLGSGFCEGIWKELPVDVRQLVSPEDDIECLREDINGSIRLAQLPYAYRYYAALKRDGRITGVIGETREGRPIRVADEDKVTYALREIEAIGLVYMDVRETHLVISFHDNQVKFVYPHRLVDLNSIPDPQEREGLIHRRHYQAAENMFLRLRDREMRGFQGMTMLTRYHTSDTFIFPRSAKPQPFLDIVVQWPEEQWGTYTSALEGLRDLIRLAGKNTKVSKHRKPKTGKEASQVYTLDAAGQSGETDARTIAQRNRRLGTSTTQHTFLFYQDSASTRRKKALTPTAYQDSAWSDVSSSELHFMSPNSMLGLSEVYPSTNYHSTVTDTGFDIPTPSAWDSAALSSTSASPVPSPTHDLSALLSSHGYTHSSLSHPSSTSSSISEGTGTRPSLYNNHQQRLSTQDIDFINSFSPVSYINNKASPVSTPKSAVSSWTSLSYPSPVGSSDSSWARVSTSPSRSIGSESFELIEANVSSRERAMAPSTSSVTSSSKSSLLAGLFDEGRMAALSQKGMSRPATQHAHIWPGTDRIVEVEDDA